MLASLFLVSSFGVWCVFDLVSLFCLLIVWMHCFVGSSHLYWLLVVQLVKCCCCCFLVFSFGFWGVFDLVLLLSFFGYCSGCSLFGCIDLVVVHFVLVIGHSVCEMLVSLFLVFSFGVWCVFDLGLLHFFSCCSVCSLFGCIVLVVCPFHKK